MEFIIFLFSMPYYILLLIIFCVILVIILIISFFGEHGLKIKFKIPWFGDVNVDTKGKINGSNKFKKDNKNATRLVCELCKINVSKLIKDIIIIYSETCNLKYVKCINYQIKELNNKIILEASWINNCHAQLVNEKIKEKNITDNELKTKLFLKNTQILGYIWMIRKQLISDFFKNSILENHFVGKNQIELRAFASEKCNVLFAKIEESVNLFPDWDDDDILIDKETYIESLRQKIAEHVQNSSYHLYERCQEIQRECDKKIKEKEEQIEVLTNNFSKSLPPYSISDDK